MNERAFKCLQPRQSSFKRASVEMEFVMPKPDIFSNLRGGAIYAAAGVAPTTARTWALKLGQPRLGGHPRYNLGDAVILSLMKALALDSGFAPGLAAALLNDKRDEILGAVDLICQEQSSSGKWRWEGGPFLHIKVGGSGFQPSDGVHIIGDEQIVSAISDRSSGDLQIIAALPRQVCKTKLRLEAVLRGDLPAEVAA
ncbi:hypothetical protein ACFFV8_10375 [Sphingobium indicum]|nr:MULTISPECIES: hypothetical protein [Sphingobium]